MKSIGKCAFVGEEKIGKGTVPSTVGPDKEYARCSWTPIFNKVYCKAIESPTLGIENLFDGYKNVSVYIVFGTSHTVKYGGGPMYIPEPTMCNENYPQYLFIPINASGYGKNGWEDLKLNQEVNFKLYNYMNNSGSNPCDQICQKRSRILTRSLKPISSMYSVIIHGLTITPFCWRFVLWHFIPLYRNQKNVQCAPCSGTIFHF